MSGEFDIRHTIIGIQGPQGIQGERGDEGAPGEMSGPDTAAEDNIAIFGADPTVLKDSGFSLSTLFPVDTTLADLGSIVSTINTVGKVADKLARDETNRLWRALAGLDASQWRPGDDQSGASDITPT